MNSTAGTTASLVLAISLALLTGCEQRTSTEPHRGTTGSLVLPDVQDLVARHAKPIAAGLTVLAEQPRVVSSTTPWQASLSVVLHCGRVLGGAGDSGASPASSAYFVQLRAACAEILSEAARLTAEEWRALGIRLGPPLLDSLAQLP